MDNLTALISSSPIKSHPSTQFIDECIQSLRDRGLTRIIVMQDGVRPEQEAYRERYEEYLTRLKNKNPDLTILSMGEHKHQARTMRDCLEFVTTPVILFIEHDMALQGDIPLQTMTDRLMGDDTDVIRLLYEDNDLLNFSYMLREKDGDFTQTVQWSGRPHLARTEYYRMILKKYFSPESKSFIEDRMHGVVDSEDNWNNHKLWIYTPEPPVNRFKINNGREDDPKWDSELVF